MSTKFKSIEPYIKPILYGVGALIVLYYVSQIMDYILEFIGVKDSKKQIEKDDNDEDDLNENVEVQKTSLTKSVAEWNQIADVIYQSLNKSSVSNDIDLAGLQVCRVRTNADVAQLMKSFSKRQDYFFGIPQGAAQGLEYFVTKKMPSKVSAINNHYKRKNISKRF